MTAVVAVIDASTLVKLALPEEHSDVVRRIITDHDDARLRLIAPDSSLRRDDGYNIRRA